MAKNSSSKTGKDKGKAAAGGPVVKTIALNKRSRHEYHLEERFEAGLALQGPTSYAVLRDVQSGSFARSFLLENQVGQPTLQTGRSNASQTQVAEVGRRLRKMMPFIKQEEG